MPRRHLRGRADERAGDSAQTPSCPHSDNMSSNSPHVPGRRQSGDVVHIHGLLNGLSRRECRALIRALVTDTSRITEPVPSVTTRTSRDAEEIKELNKLTPYQRTVYCALESLCGGQWSQSILEGVSPFSPLRSNSLQCDSLTCLSQAGLWELVQERGDDSHREALDVYRCQGLLKRLAGQVRELLINDPQSSSSHLLPKQRQLSEDELMRLNYALGHYTFLSGFWRRVSFLSVSLSVRDARADYA